MKKMLTQSVVSVIKTSAASPTHHDVALLVNGGFLIHLLKVKASVQPVEQAGSSELAAPLQWHSQVDQLGGEPDEGHEPKDIGGERGSVPRVNVLEAH